MLTAKKYIAEVRRKKSIEKCIGETLRLTIKICSGATWYRAKDQKKKRRLRLNNPPKKNQPTSGQINAKTNKTKRGNTEINTWTNNSWERTPYIQNVRSSGAPLACYSADCLHERIVFYVRAFDRFVDHCFPSKNVLEMLSDLARRGGAYTLNQKASVTCQLWCQCLKITKYYTNWCLNALVKSLWCPGAPNTISFHSDLRCFNFRDVVYKSIPIL